jgi:catechol 2,3-dioxygenase-like lactoylglutathione lyase family enzyme
MRRTSHIAVRVPPDKAEAAEKFYTEALGLERRQQDTGEVGLFGENFVLWVDSSDHHHLALQEFAGRGAKAAKERFLALGCEVFDESPQGFHVRDPFGLSFHVWIEDENPAPE